MKSFDFDLDYRDALSPNDLKIRAPAFGALYERADEFRREMDGFPHVIVESGRGLPKTPFSVTGAAFKNRRFFFEDRFKTFERRSLRLLFEGKFEYFLIDLLEFAYVDFNIPYAFTSLLLQHAQQG